MYQWDLATDGYCRRVHVVAVLACDGVIGFDLATPVEVFGRVQLSDGQPAYELRVCAPRRVVEAGPYAVRAPWGLSGLRGAHTVIVPGVADPLAPVAPQVLQAVRAAAARGTRVASICVGAFALAAAGLLDGRRATTHWAAAAELARRYPDVEVDPNVLYVDEGAVLTSAGAAAGLDLCLHLVRRDHGAAVAAQAARVSVMPLERLGGQAQFIAGPAGTAAPTGAGSSLQPLLEWVACHLDEELTLADLAAVANLSTRTLIRRFRAHTGTTPLIWVTRQRIHAAQELLETTDTPVEQIGALVGIPAATTFRQRFRTVTGVTPSGYRATFRARA
jgi:transcriptional regulator GlxA family with amidase domain